MTKKALKLLLSMQAKSTFWFVAIYSLIMAILFIVFSFISIDDTSWIPISNIYSPKLYLMVIGIIYPLISIKLYVSQGLTRKQFFWAYTGAISIISLFLLIPLLASIAYYDNISFSSAILHYIQMPLFFLIGWTSALSYQMRKWYTIVLGIVFTIVMFHSITTIPIFFSLSNTEVLGLTLLLLAALLLILPRIISEIPLKN